MKTSKLMGLSVVTLLALALVFLQTRMVTAQNPPTITGLTVSRSATATTVTITGTNLTGATAVKFNGQNATSFTVNSGTQITATVPPDAAGGPITVTTPAGTASSTFFIIPPRITGFSPTNGPPGTDVIITGANFQSSSNSTETLVSVGVLNVNLSALTLKTLTRTQIIATITANASNGPINVSHAGGVATSANNFSVQATITGFTPASAQAGSTVQISGSNFIGATAVKFNGVLSSSTFTVNSASLITATVPLGATSGSVTVTLPGGTLTSATSFIVLATPPPPTITGFSPADGGAGPFPSCPPTVVTIHGTNLVNITAVKFNAVTASFSVTSDTLIKTNVPAGATTGPITIVTPGGVTLSTSNFTVHPKPIITGFAPAAGDVGTTVIINGANFTGVCNVSLGLKDVNFTVNSATKITTTVPPDAINSVIKVLTHSGLVFSNSAFFLPPKITGFSPSFGDVGTTVIITGSSLGPAAAIKFNGASATEVTFPGLTARATVPSTATTGRITVTTPGGTSVSTTDFTMFEPPTITGFSPASGGVGIPVTITGSNFVGVGPVIVKFNGVTANSSFTKGSTIASGGIIAPVPPGATSGHITVTTPKGTATSTINFVVVPSPAISSFSPTSGSAGRQIVTINGSNLTGATSVKFNGLNASLFTVNSSIKITVMVPLGATTGPISVTTPGGTVTTITNFAVATL